jgi:pimeloyl-ACP methyl ester carboxylesterase
MPLMQGKKTRISGQVAGALLALMGGVIMFAALQRQLIYFPETAPEEALLTAAERSGLQAWRDRDGELIGWRAHSPDKPRRRLVVFHGNAGHALYRQYFAAGFLALAAGWQVYLFEYPGYGARPGSPSESGIKSAAAEAVEALLAEDAGPVYLLGESLGSGVATYLAGTLGSQIAGLLLVTPFTSLADVAGHHYGGLPARALLRERYDSAAALDHYRGPVAFLVAGSDEIVPAALGRKLYDSYRGPRLLREQPGAGHNSLDFNPDAPWWREVTDFWLSRR